MQEREKNVQKSCQLEAFHTIWQRRQFIKRLFMISHFLLREILKFLEINTFF